LAYLAASPVAEKARLIDGLRRRHPDDWGQVRARIEAAHDEYVRRGFVSSQKSWGRDVSAVAVPMSVDHSPALFAVNCSGPASQLSVSLLQKKLGPALCDTVARIAAEMQRHPVVPLRPPSVHLP
jgi:DNA-binding IclR family transcriptional regulator